MFTFLNPITGLSRPVMGFKEGKVIPSHHKFVLNRHKVRVTDRVVKLTMNLSAINFPFD